MTETRPTYNAIPAEQAAARRSLVASALTANARAAVAWLEPLLAYARRLQLIATDPQASEHELTAAFQEAYCLSNAAAALAAGLPEAKQ